MTSCVQLYVALNHFHIALISLLSTTVAMENKIWTEMLNGWSKTNNFSAVHDAIRPVRKIAERANARVQMIIIRAFLCWLEWWNGFLNFEFRIGKTTLHLTFDWKFHNMLISYTRTSHTNRCTLSLDTGSCDDYSTHIQSNTKTISITAFIMKKIYANFSIKTFLKFIGEAIQKHFSEK